MSNVSYCISGERHVSTTRQQRKKVPHMHSPYDRFSSDKSDEEIVKEMLEHKYERTYLRNCLQEINSSLKWGEEDFLASDIGQALCRRLDNKQNRIIPLEHRRRKHSFLTDEEFYLQSLEYWQIATDLLQRDTERRELQEELEDLKADYPEVLKLHEEEVAKLMQEDGYLKCEVSIDLPKCNLPSEYLAELISKQDGR